MIRRHTAINETPVDTGDSTTRVIGRQVDGDPRAGPAAFLAFELAPYLPGMQPVTLVTGRGKLVLYAVRGTTTSRRVVERGRSPQTPRNGEQKAIPLGTDVLQQQRDGAECEEPARELLDMPALVRVGIYRALETDHAAIDALRATAKTFHSDRDLTDSRFRSLSYEVRRAAAEIAFAQRYPDRALSWYRTGEGFLRQMPHAQQSAAMEKLYARMWFLLPQAQTAVFERALISLEHVPDDGLHRPLAVLARQLVGCKIPPTQKRGFFIRLQDHLARVHTEHRSHAIAGFIRALVIFDEPREFYARFQEYMRQVRDNHEKYLANRLDAAHASPREAWIALSEIEDISPLWLHNLNPRLISIAQEIGGSDGRRIMQARIKSLASCEPEKTRERFDGIMQGCAKFQPRERAALLLDLTRAIEVLPRIDRYAASQEIARLARALPVEQKALIARSLLWALKCVPRGERYRAWTDITQLLTDVEPTMQVHALRNSIELMAEMPREMRVSCVEYLKRLVAEPQLSVDAKHELRALMHTWQLHLPDDWSEARSRMPGRSPTRI